MGFVQDFLEVTKEVETPTRFLEWAALSCISAVVKRKVFVSKRGILKVYPNIYVMLVAKSAHLRKSFAPIFAGKLIDASEATKVIDGRNSIQSIIKQLSEARQLESGVILNDAACCIIADELNTLLVDDPASQSILTTLYDSNYHDKWVNTLKKEGREVLNDLYVTMISATNETNLTGFLDTRSISGGFIGRTILVYEEKKSKINSMIGGPDLPPMDVGLLVQQLKQIAKLSGRFTFLPSAENLFNSWYETLQTKLNDDPTLDKTGTLGRIHDTVLKVAMLESLSERRDLVFTESHIEAAIIKSQGHEKDTGRIIEGRGRGELSVKIKLLLDDLLSAEGYCMLRKVILSKHWGDFDYTDLDKMVELMHQSDKLEIIKTNRGEAYKLKESFVEQFRQMMNQGIKVEKGN